MPCQVAFRLVVDLEKATVNNDIAFRPGPADRPEDNASFHGDAVGRLPIGGPVDESIGLWIDFC